MTFTELLSLVIRYGVGGGLAVGCLAHLTAYVISRTISLFSKLTNSR